MRSYNYIIAVILLLLQMVGCTTTKLPPTNLYTINISTFNEKSAIKPHSEKTLKVAIPRSTAAIMSRNILYQDRSYTLNAYAFSKWSDTPNRMLANLFLTDIKDSSIFKVVLPSDSAGKSDYVLESSLQQFHQQINKDGSSSARMRIGFYLIEARTGKVKVAREFTSTNRSTSVDARGGVEALNRASEDIGSSLIDWLSTLEL